MSPSPLTVIIILFLGVLFFGKNLPAVAKQIGSSLLEFRKGLNEWKEEFRGPSANVDGARVSRSVSGSQGEPEEYFESLGTKFEPPSDG